MKKDVLFVILTLLILLMLSSEIFLGSRIETDPQDATAHSGPLKEVE
jgi:hypothetical protein